jgi:hypothetical protein
MGCGFTGSIADVSLYTRQLSAADVAAHYVALANQVKVAEPGNPSQPVYLATPATDSQTATVTDPSSKDASYVCAGGDLVSLSAACYQQEQRRLAALRAAAERAAKETAARAIRAVKVVARVAVKVGKIAYKVSGVQSIVSCVTDPTLSSCLQAAVTVVMIAAIVATGGAAGVADAAEGAAESATESATKETAEATAEETTTQAKSAFSLRNAGIGPGFGALGGALSGMSASEGWKQITLDTATGAAFGAVGGAPNGAGASVFAGAVAGAGNSVGQQLIGDGGHFSGISASAVGINAVLGAGTNGFGAYAGASEDRLGENWAPVVSAAFGVGEAGTCTIAAAFRAKMC